MEKLNRNRNLKSGKIYYTPVERYLEKVSNVFLAFCVLVCVVIIIFNTCIFSAEIHGISMKPTFNNHWETAYDEKPSDIAYYSSKFNPRRGDVIVVDLVEAEVHENEWYGIKRLIALSKDVVEFKDYVLYVNGQKINEDYLENGEVNQATVNNIIYALQTNQVDQKHNWISFNYEDVTNDESASYSSYLKFEIPEGYFFYLGDNRAESLDCSIVGPQKLEKLLAKVVFVVPYNENIVSYFWKQFCGLFKS